MDKWIVHTGDCLEVMATLPANSVDAVVTDPPYGLAFMGKAWDHAVPGPEFFAAMLRVAKPGAHLVSFGGTRLYHRMTCAMEDAGWEIRDCLMWLYGSGFPKSHNGDWGGTALKPAWEPIVLARKPLDGTVAANHLRHGCGGLNVDGCRVGTEGGERRGDASGSRKSGTSFDVRNWQSVPLNAGRWPANLILGEEAGAVLDEQAGVRPGASSFSRPGGKGNCYGTMGSQPLKPGYGDTGGASRFFFNCGGLLSNAEAIMQAWKIDHANGAELHSSLLKSAVDSALKSAATSHCRAETLSSEWTEPTTNATQTESNRLCVTAMLGILTIDGRYSPESLPTKPTERHGLVRSVARDTLTGTTTITVSHWKSDGSAAPVMFSITPPSTVLGEAACRFRYCPKASKADRDEGLEGFEASDKYGPAGQWASHDCFSGKSGDDAWKAKNPNYPKRNHHPTVKPTDLMRWLCRLVTPTGGTVLDPFTGSGSTGKAAVLEGFRFIGIEREPEYADIARARIGNAVAGAELFTA